MIIAFTGTPGSGKTYDAVRKIVENLRLGRVVYTNVEGMDAPECLEMLKAVTGLSDYALLFICGSLNADRYRTSGCMCSPVQ